MDTIETNERITAGLPDVIAEIPKSLQVALDAGIIKTTDLAPNIAAQITSEHRPNVEPPLTTLELVDRNRHIRSLAERCVQNFLNQ